MTPPLLQTNGQGGDRGQVVETPRKHMRTAAAGEHRNTLQLKQVLGHTATLPNAFSAHVESSRFALCAGSVAVVNQIDGAFNISQKHYRATPSPSTVGTAVDVEQLNASPLERRNRGLNSPQTTTSASISQLRGSKDSPARSGHHLKPRSATCLTFSQDGKYLAVGETGHAPRVLLFSTASDADERPVATAAEHAHAVKHLSFSPDGRLLASVGDLHDGSIITVGTRHIKTWRPELHHPTPSSSPTKSRFRQDARAGSLPPSPAPKGLPGRNALLGPLLDANFTTIRAISDLVAIVGTDSGDVCQLSSTTGSHRLEKLFNAGEPVKSITVDVKDQIWVACQSGSLWTAALAHLSIDGDGSLWRRCKGKLHNNIVVVASFSDTLLAIDSQRTISFYETTDTERDPVLGSLRSTTLCHSAAVLGVCLLSGVSDDIAFMTYDSTGFVIFWGSSGQYRKSHRVVLNSPQSTNETDPNELRVCLSSSTMDFFAAGDTHGFISILDQSLEQCHVVKAHQNEINDIVLRNTSNKGTIVASAGRDRMVQTFRKIDQNLELIQTIDQHGSSVNQLSFLEQKDVLLSLSSDRTIVFSCMIEHGDSIAFVNVRTLTFKQSPIAMAVIPGKTEMLLVTTTDKQLHRYQSATGQLESSVRVLDANLPITIDIMVARGRRGEVQGEGEGKETVYDSLIAVSMTDRSIRIHSLESGSTLAKVPGHSECVSGICVLDHYKTHDLTSTAVTCSLDGSVMLWQLPRLEPTQGKEADPSLNWPSEVPFLGTPLRKVLSKSLLSDMAASLDISPFPRTPTRGRSPTRPPRMSLTRNPSSSPPKSRAGMLRSSWEELLTEMPLPSPRLNPVNELILGQDQILEQPAGIKERTERLIQALQQFREDFDDNEEALDNADLKRLRRELELALNAADHKPCMSNELFEAACNTVDGAS